MYWRMGKKACWRSLAYLRGKSVFLMQVGLDLLDFLVHVGWTKVNIKYPQQLPPSSSYRLREV